MSNSTLIANRLKEEKSLIFYNTYNINWYPWGEEAFVKSKKIGRYFYLLNIRVLANVYDAKPIYRTTSSKKYRLRSCD